MGYKAGELYILGEVEPTSGARTPFVKIGIVKESDDRDTAKRVKEHQTGNPREITELHVIATPNVEDVETALHGIYAPIRIGGEWFHCDDAALAGIIARAEGTAATMRDAEADFIAADKMKDVASSGDRRDPTATEADLGREFTAIRSAIKEAKAAEKSVRLALQAAHDRDSGFRRYVDVQQRRPSRSFDRDRFANEQADLNAEFSITETKVRGPFRTLNTPDVDHTAITADLGPLTAEIATLADAVTSGADRVTDLHGLYLELLAMWAPFDVRNDVLDATVRVACADRPGINGICTWNRLEVVEPKLDTAALKAAHPDLYEQYMKTTQSKPAVVPVRHRGYRL